MKGRPLAPPAAQRAQAHAHADAHARMHSAHARIRTHTHARTATYTPTHAHMYPVVHVWCARSRPARPRVGAVGRAGVSAAAAALTDSSGSASRPPPAAPRARCRTRPCAPTVRPRRAAPAHRGGAPVGCGRQAVRARGSADGRRPATPPPPHPTTRGPAWRLSAAAPRAAAQRPHRRKRARRRRARDAQFLQELAPAEPLGERLHLRAEDVPAVHRARVRPALAAH
jgi:hypothetical protein